MSLEPQSRGASGGMCVSPAGRGKMSGLGSRMSKDFTPHLLRVFSLFIGEKGNLVLALLECLPWGYLGEENVVIKLKNIL